MNINGILAELQLRKELLKELKAVNKELSKYISETNASDLKEKILKDRPDAKVIIITEYSELINELSQHHDRCILILNIT